MYAKGFTLIELLVVISIIGVLSSISMAALNAARLKAKDAALKAEAGQMRNLLELEYSDTGSYLGLNPNNGWMMTSTDCDNAPFTGNYASQARTLCKSIVSKSSNSYTSLEFYLGVSGSPSNQFSIIIALPGKDRFFCLGSSGRSSDIDQMTWLSPGCWLNP